MQLLTKLIFSTGILFLFAINGLAQVSPCLSDSLFDREASNQDVSHGVFMTNSTWLAGQKITVKFLDGDEFLHAKVRQYAEEWEKYANVDFVFVGASERAQIRIRFTLPGSWSLVGKNSEKYSVVKADKSVRTVSGDGEASMNFGWFDRNTAEAEFRKTTLHEFGHALGLLHEHQNAARDFEWNVPVVENYYWVYLGWDKTRVYENVLKHYGSGTTYSNKLYDKFSVMHYPIPANFTTNGRSVGDNRDLSAGDKAIIAEMYPFKNTGTASAFSFKNINVEYGARKDNELGMMISVDFAVAGSKNERQTMAAHFYSVDGKPLKDTNKKNYSQNGVVATHDYFTPQYDRSEFTKFKLFMPYSELELGCGEYKLKFEISSWKGNALTAKSGSQYFSYWKCAAADKIDVDVAHNVEVDGKKGMKIFPRFSIRHAKAQPLKVVAYFYRANGEPLKDTNKVNYTTEGYVSAMVPIKPCCDVTNYGLGKTYDFFIFIPYVELHLSGERRHDLKFFVQILEGSRSVSRSAWKSFYFDSKSP